MQIKLGAQSQLMEHLAFQILSQLCQQPRRGPICLAVEEIAIQGWGLSKQGGVTEALRAPDPELGLSRMTYSEFIKRLETALRGLHYQGHISQLGVSSSRSPSRVVWQVTAGGRKAHQQFCYELGDEFYAWLVEWDEGCDW